MLGPGQLHDVRAVEEAAVDIHRDAGTSQVDESEVSKEVTNLRNRRVGGEAVDQDIMTGIMDDLSLDFEKLWGNMKEQRAQKQAEMKEKGKLVRKSIKMRRP
jgi:hypothetical protein